MRKDEEVIVMFYWGLETLEKMFHQKATVTKKAGWITIKFGTLAEVQGRGYKNALALLDQELEELVQRVAEDGNNA